MSSSLMPNSWRARILTSDAELLACTYQAAPWPQLSVSWWSFNIYQKFLPANLCRGGILLSGNLTPQPLQQNLLSLIMRYCSHSYSPHSHTPTRESSILSSPLTFFHAQISSSLKEDTRVLIASFRSHPILFLLSSQAPQICSLHPQSPFTFL